MADERDQSTPSVAKPSVPATTTTTIGADDDYGPVISSFGLFQGGFGGDPTANIPRRPYDDPDEPIRMFGGELKFNAANILAEPLWKMSLVWFRGLGLLINVGVPLVGVLAAIEAYRFPELSFQQLIAIEVAAGTSTFALLPLIVAAADKHPVAVRIALCLMAALLGVGSYKEEGVTRHLLIEGCSAIVLVLALELTASHLAKRIKQAYQRTLEAGPAFSNDGDD
jgi:hypothetical protein